MKLNIYLSRIRPLLRSATSKKHLYQISDISTRCVSNEAVSKSKIDVNTMTLSKYIKAMIDFKGPISVSEYMKEALTNTMLGYYMKKDVLGVKGDFITSPEISQVFGELIAVWIINEWMKIGSPKPLYIIELGPGRGTMLRDILRVFKKLNMHHELSCHLVEVSNEMSQMQAHNLNVKLDTTISDLQYYQNGVTCDGIPVFWYNNFQSIPTNLSVVIAHEFFDALPIHKFKKTEEGWKEVMIDFDPSDKEGKTFKYVVSKETTPLSKVLIKKSETREEIEVSPQSAIIMNEMAIRLEQYGGFALIADYGHDGESTDSFRAFRGHQQKDPLVDPGSADLTADVDFNYLKENTLNKLISFGPVTQREFLSRLHIEARIKILLQNCKDEEVRNSIQSGYRMLIDKNEMGERFKFISFFPEVLKDHLTKYPVVGFFNVE